MQTVFTPVFEPEQDPLDVQLHRLGAAPARVRALPWHARFGLSWSFGSAPVLLLLLAGAAAGPHGLAVLTPGLLNAIDPAIPVALATVGAQVGLTLAWPRKSAPLGRIVAAACVETCLTALLAGAGLLLLLRANEGSTSAYVWLIALPSAVAASMSAWRTPHDLDPATPMAALQGIAIACAFVLGGAVLAWLREGTALGAAWLFGQGALLAVVVALAAWLMASHAAADIELRIFGIAAMLLIGGAADYLSLSALLSGLVAGVFWRRLGGPAADSIRSDIGYLYHPLLVLLLVVAGARTGTSALVLTLTAAYLLLRLVAKLLGGLTTRRLLRPSMPEDVGLLLVTPGVFAVAFALNVVRAAGAQTEAIVSIVVLGTIGSQLVAAIRRPQEPPPA